MEKSTLSQAIQVLAAVSEAIRDLGSVPSGHLYAQLAGRMDLETYQAIIQTLKGAGLIKVENHLITWIGPEK